MSLHQFSRYFPVTIDYFKLIESVVSVRIFPRASSRWALLIWLKYTVYTCISCSRYGAVILKIKKNCGCWTCSFFSFFNSSLTQILDPKYVAECGEMERVRRREEVGCQKPPEIVVRSRIPRWLLGRCEGTAFPGPLPQHSYKLKTIFQI